VGGSRCGAAGVEVEFLVETGDGRRDGEAGANLTSCLSVPSLA
jgi:hypothetical protein